MARYGRGYGGRSGWGDPRGGSYPEAFEYGRSRGYRGYGGRYDGGYDGGWADAGPARPRAYPWEGARAMGRGGGYAEPYRRGRGGGAGSDADSIRAADIMTANPETVTPDTPLAEVARRMRDLDVGIIPVVAGAEDRRLRGVITDRDIAVRAAAEARDMEKATASEYMTEGVETVGESDPVREVFSVMKRARVRRVPVTDREGRLVGIVAQADLAVSYAGLDVRREAEVEEVIERISEPGGSGGARGGRRPAARHRGYDGRDLGDRLRAGWRTIREEARHLIPGDRGHGR